MNHLRKSHGERNLVYAALWLSLFLWGLQAPGGRYLALAGVPILGVMAMRFWIGFLCFGLYLGITGKFDFSLKVYWKEILFLFSGGLFLNEMVFLGFRLNPILIIGACGIIGSAIILILKKEAAIIPD